MAENATQSFCLTCGETPDGHTDGAHEPVWVDADSGPRSLRVIAREIEADWSQRGKGVYYGAVPYLAAMHMLDSIEGTYFEDSAASIVRYFLANAMTWRGETARRIKAELKAQLETVKGRY